MDHQVPEMASRCAPSHPGRIAVYTNTAHELTVDVIGYFR